MSRATELTIGIEGISHGPLGATAGTPPGTAYSRGDRRLNLRAPCSAFRWKTSIDLQGWLSRPGSKYAAYEDSTGVSTMPLVRCPWFDAPGSGSASAAAAHSASARYLAPGTDSGTRPMARICALGIICSRPWESTKRYSESPVFRRRRPLVTPPPVSRTSTKG